MTLLRDFGTVHRTGWVIMIGGVVAIVAGSESQVREHLAAVERFIVTAADVELLDVETAWLESERA